MQKLTIKNSEWLRAKGRCGMLFNPDSKCYCVQGLYCKALDMPDHVMEYETEVCDVHGCFHWESNRESLWLVNEKTMKKSDQAQEIEDINDDPSITDAQRIELLKPIFAAHGVEIEYREDE